MYFLLGLGWLPSQKFSSWYPHFHQCPHAPGDILFNHKSSHMSYVHNHPSRRYMMWSHLSDVICSPLAHSALTILISLYFLEYAKSVSTLELEHLLLPLLENLICLMSPWLRSYSHFVYVSVPRWSWQRRASWGILWKTAAFPPLPCSPTSYFFLYLLLNVWIHKCGPNKQ